MAPVVEEKVIASKPVVEETKAAAPENLTKPTASKTVKKTKEKSKIFTLSLYFFIKWWYEIYVNLKTRRYKSHGKKKDFDGW